jgi:ribonuclease HI
LEEPVVKIYTDGSCHSQRLVGAWAAILFIKDEKVIIQGSEVETTHNRMELLAVIKAVNYIVDRGLKHTRIEIYSDSQYVVNLRSRIEKLKQRNFITNKGTPIQNSDLVQSLINLIEQYDLDFTKVKAHQKNGDEINREVDIIVRKLLRKNVSQYD